MEQAKGNFVTQIVRDKRPGDNKPVYTGKFVKPGTEDEYGFSLFVGKSVEGKRYFSGPVSRQPLNGSLDVQMDALMEPEAPAAEGQREYRLFLLENQFKAEQGGEDRPTLWGRIQLGAAEPEIQVSVWEKESRYQINPHVSKYLTGQTQYALEKTEPATEKKGRKASKSDLGR